MANSSATAATIRVRHCLIGVRNDRHGRHAGGECEGESQDQENLFHDRLPSSATP